METQNLPLISSQKKWEARRSRAPGPSTCGARLSTGATATTSQRNFRPSMGRWVRCKNSISIFLSGFVDRLPARQVQILFLSRFGSQLRPRDLQRGLHQAEQEDQALHGLVCQHSSVPRTSRSTQLVSRQLSPGGLGTEVYNLHNGVAIYWDNKMNQIRHSWRLGSGLTSHGGGQKNLPLYRGLSSTLRKIQNILSLGVAGCMGAPCGRR